MSPNRQLFLTVSSIAKFIERHFQECNDRPPTCRHIVVVAHGIFNAEFIGALLARRRSPSLDWGYKGDPDPHLATFADEAILRDDECELIPYSFTEPA